MDDANKCPSEKDELQSTLRSIQIEIDDLYKTVYKGNGQPSLVTQTVSLEGKLRGLRESFSEKFEHLHSENMLKFDALNATLENKFIRYETYVDSKFSHIENLIKMRMDDDRADRASSRSGVWAIRAALIAAAIATITSIAMVILR